MRKNLILLFLIALTGAACNPDDTDLPPVVPPVVEKPIFSDARQKVYFATIPAYRDRIRFYYYNYRVTQTNPAVTVDPAVIAAREDSLNNLFLTDPVWPEQALLPIGMEINGTDMGDLYLAWNAYTGYNLDDIVPMADIIEAGRDSLIRVFRRKHDLTISSRDDIYVRDVRMWTDNNDFEMYNGVWHSLSIKPWPGVGSQIYLEEYRIFRYDDSPPMPNARIKEYLFVRDRFHDRSYTDDAGKTYTTKVVIKKLSEVEGFDPAAMPSLDTDYWNMRVRYPIVQLFEGDEMIFEGKIDDYTEEVGTADNGSYRTNVEFRAATLKDGLYVALQYASYYSTYFQIRGLDLTNPDPGEDFSTKYTRTIKTVDDNKEGGKKTVSYATP